MHYCARNYNNHQMISLIIVRMIGQNSTRHVIVSFAFWFNLVRFGVNHVIMCCSAFHHERSGSCRVAKSMQHDNVLYCSMIMCYIMGRLSHDLLCFVYFLLFGWQCVRLRLAEQRLQPASQQSNKNDISIYNQISCTISIMRGDANGSAPNG